LSSSSSAAAAAMGVKGVDGVAGCLGESSCRLSRGVSGTADLPRPAGVPGIGGMLSSSLLLSMVARAVENATKAIEVVV
jgi:hypothetical protein